MQAAEDLTALEIVDLLIDVAEAMTVFIWGPPGAGKTAVVNQFADSLGYPCVPLIGSNIAPEDVIGLPKITSEGLSRFCPPEFLSSERPFVLFLDELNACTVEVQKAFYSLIQSHRVGNLVLPKGSIIISAGNRSSDAAIVRQMSSALIGRQMHVNFTVNPSIWLDWAGANEIHQTVIDHIAQNPTSLMAKEIPKHEEPFSCPRAWENLSTGIKLSGDRVNLKRISTLSRGWLSPQHAARFQGFWKIRDKRFFVDRLFKGDEDWPTGTADRDTLYYLAEAFGQQLAKELPEDGTAASSEVRAKANQAKKLLARLASISGEVASAIVGAEDDGQRLPAWFVNEIARDLPRIAASKKN